MASRSDGVHLAWVFLQWSGIITIASPLTLPPHLGMGSCNCWIEPCCLCSFIIVMSLPHAVNCVRFCFWRCLWLFACVWNILGTAERICAKLTGKTCLVPRWVEFEEPDVGRKSQTFRIPRVYLLFARPHCNFTEIFGSRKLRVLQHQGRKLTQAGIKGFISPKISWVYCAYITTCFLLTS